MDLLFLFLSQALLSGCKNFLNLFHCNFQAHLLYNFSNLHSFLHLFRLFFVVPVINLHFVFILPKKQKWNDDYV